MKEGDRYAEWEDGRLLGHYAQTGEEAAFAEVVRRHGGVVLAVCRRVLQGSSGAEDAAQAVFLTLAQKAGELVGRNSVAGWLYQVAWRVAMRAREAAAIQRKYEQEAAAMNQPAASQDQEWEHLRPALDEELAALPEKYRLPLVLHYLEGRTLDEAAKLLQTRLWTVATHVRRGRELLRTRLARRGITLTGAVLVGLLVEEASASAAFVASTVQAAGLLTAGHVAAGGAVSSQTLALVKGTLNMMYWAKLKMAAGLLVAALLPVAAGVATWQLAPPAGAQQIGNPGNPGNPGVETHQVESMIWPTQATAVDYANLQAEALRKKIDVSYRRAYVAEVVGDLEKRSGVRVACAQALGNGWTFTLEEKGITVQAVLEKLATDGKFDLAQRPEMSVLTQKADDQVLIDLAKQLANPDRWQRCQAVWGLGNLADARIYPLLTKGLADPDVGVVEWTLKSLERHSRMGIIMPDPLKDAIVKLVKPWLKDLQTKDLRGVIAVIAPSADGFGPYRPKGPAMGPGLFERQPRLELLGATGRPEAIAALVEAGRSGQFDAKEDQPIQRPTMLRVGAVRALAANRVGAAELVGTLGIVQKELTDQLTKIEQEAKTANKPVEMGIVYWKLSPTKRIREQVILALVGMRVPEFVRTAQELVDKTERSEEDEALALALFTEYPAVLDLRTYVQRDLKTFTADFQDKTAAAAHAADIGAQPQRLVPVYGERGARTLWTLSQVSDPAVTAEFLKVARDKKAFESLSRQVFELLIGQTSWDRTKLILPVEDPELAAALLTQLEASNTSARFAARCLGQSHDPEVAEALIEALKGVDEESVGVVGEALGRTRDGRALAALVAVVQEKRHWPDVEKEGRAAMMNTGEWPADKVNPRKALVRAIFDTRDPQAFTELAALAMNPKLDAEVRLTAQQQLCGAAYSAAEMDRLMELLQGTEPKVQREILCCGAISNTAFFEMAPFPRAPTLRCVNEPRWVALVAARATDKEASQPARGPVTAPFRNTMIDLLAWFKTPLAEKTMLDLCDNPDEHVAYFAGQALVRFGDPKVTVQFDQ